MQGRSHASVPASAEMRQWFGLDVMADPDAARAWFEALWQNSPFTAEAVDAFRQLRLEVGTLDEPLGGGYWIAEAGLVLLRGAQREAAIHELAHAWWEPRREAGRDELLAVLRELGEHPLPAYGRASELARVYCEGIPSQPEPSSPTGWWRGMLADGNDHETFAGFCSGLMGDAALLPPRLRGFYAGLLKGA